jgi:hypothetical protein
MPKHTKGLAGFLLGKLAGGRAKNVTARVSDVQEMI